MVKVAGWQKGLRQNTCQGSFAQTSSYLWNTDINLEALINLPLIRDYLVTILEAFVVNQPRFTKIYFGHPPSLLLAFLREMRPLTYHTTAIPGTIIYKTPPFYSRDVKLRQFNCGV